MPISTNSTILPRGVSVISATHPPNCRMILQTWLRLFSPVSARVHCVGLRVKCWSCDENTPTSAVLCFGQRLRRLSTLNPCHSLADEIFNAFFTTKPQGSGMGLAISYSIVESHSGRLWATSNDGRGATFHFTLPTTVVEVSATI